MGTIIDYEYRYTDRLRASPNNRVVTRPSEKFEGNYYMQNKPNFQNAKMNITSAITKDYENIPPLENAKTNPIKPNFNTKYAKQTQFQKDQNEHKLSFNKGLRKYSPHQKMRKQTQSNPISIPIMRKQTQIKPNFSPKTRPTNPIKPNFIQKKARS